MSEKNNYQLMDDTIRVSLIEIDGVHFVASGFDNSGGYSDIDLQNGLQNRIHKAIIKIAEALNITDCRSIITADDIEK